MSIIKLLSLFLSIGLISPYAYADNIYKIVDKNGHISYSATPPTSEQKAQKIAMPPPPSDNDVKAAKERHENNLRAEKIYSNSRLEREKKIADEIRLRQEKKELYIPPAQKYEEPKKEGPYYGIPGRGILVLPKGPRIKSP